MTNNENPKRLHTEAHWAKFLDRTSDDSEESSIGRMTHCDLTEGHLEDLEIDSVIRELGRSEQNEHEFVGKVLGKLELPNSHPVPRKKVRLPVPAPVFETEHEESEQVFSLSRKVRRILLSPNSLLTSACLMLAMMIGYWSMDPTQSDIDGFASHRSSSVPLETERPIDPPTEADTPAPQDNPAASPSWLESNLARLLDRAWTLPDAIPPDDDNRERFAKAPPVKRWTLALDFDQFGMGTISVNGNRLPEVVFCGNADMVLENIGQEVLARFKQLESRLIADVQGTIRVNQQEFHFGNPDQIRQKIVQAASYIGRIKVDSISSEDFMRRRAEFIREREFRAFMAAGTGSENPTDDTNLPNHSRSVFVTTDEEASINSVVQETEVFLRDWANQIAQWQKDSNISDEQLATLIGGNQTDTTTISQKDFNDFRLEGKNLVVANIQPKVPTIKSLQKLKADDLRQQLLANTRSMDIFEDAKQAQEAEMYVRRNDNRGVSERANQMGQQLLTIENRLTELSLSNSDDPSVHRATTNLENQYIEVADRLDHFRKENGIEPLLEFLNERPDLKGLPLAMGDECHMEPERALAMSHISKTVGVTLAQFDNFGTRDARQNDSWRYNMLKDKIIESSTTFNDEHSLTTLDQMLQVDHPRLRVELINALKTSGSERAIELLTRRAKFDLTPEVRLAATNALTKFAPEKYRQHLLEGFEYPWVVVAQHSAEALVRLNDTDSLDKLVQLLRSPSPDMPRKSSGNGYIQREVVAINHMRNCLLCHAPSTGQSDRGRAVVPTWDQPLPRLYYHSRQGSFVRADTTYLRQDFSVMQEVEDHGPWPKVQRYDYVVYENELTNEQAKDYFLNNPNQKNLHREAILFALRELTGIKLADDSHASWVAAIAKFKRSKKK